MTFLECAAQGKYKGGEPGNKTGRSFVPGSAAVVDTEGNLELQDQKSVERVEYQITEVTWKDFREFLFFGQIYE
jgi:hypothetical protein